MDIIASLTSELNVGRGQVEAAVKLIDEGNTIPFIARYRKEATGSLNDEVLRTLDERLRYLRGLEEKKAQVMASIADQGKLTGELKKKIGEARTMVAVDDLYLPYRPKRKTRASMARERGLEPLADWIASPNAGTSLEDAAKPYVSEEKGVDSVKTAIAGAKDILAERIAEDAGYRTWVREITMNEGRIASEVRGEEDPESVYEKYFHHEEPAKSCPGHRVLALNRGEKEKILTVKVEAPEEKILQYLEAHVITGKDPVTSPVLKEVVKDSYGRLMAPAIEREIRNAVTEKAENGAFQVFKKTLNQLLMEPPISGQVVLGWDPAFRTGCKLAVVDPTGKVLDTTVVYPTPPASRTEEAKKILTQLIQKYGVTVIAVGNGTASKESEIFVAQLLGELNPKLQRKVSYMVVSEAGASVYSASELGAKEFPQFDVSLRSAVSIARRLQDPLAELVKIDPKSIGVGQYQHDMPAKEMDAALGGVVEDCVNRVGVDLNTASQSLLSYVAGINQTVAKNIVSYREESGSFTKRSQLMKVPKLGKKAFEQCAGFLRVPESEEPLDRTGVHPESYPAAQKLLTLCGYQTQDLLEGKLEQLAQRVAQMGQAQVAQRIGVGEPTLRDMVAELSKPGRDPRDELPKPLLRTDVMEMSDLKEGMVLTGTVRNVTDFGAFVDIAVHEDGLVHISQISKRRISHPSQVLKVGDIVQVKVLEVDLERRRISLTMKDL